MSTLSTEQVTFDLTKCSFCATYHANRGEAEKHGCANGIPPQQLKVGDEVWAEFALGRGMEEVGKKTLKARVIKIQAPSEAYGTSKAGVLERGRGYMNRLDTSLSFNAAIFNHEWVVTVQALERPNPEEGYVIEQCLFRESELRKVEV